MLMHHLDNKRIILGVSGGIAAYKSAEIVRILIKAGADVRVVMTTGATKFITPLTFQALSANPVHIELLDAEIESGMGHIELARWADVVLIAPATADFVARMAVGRGDDLLSTLCLATRATICIAPAMNKNMWLNPATIENTSTLKKRNIKIFYPAVGIQACGDNGPGRMMEPADLVFGITNLFTNQKLTGNKLIITAGPTLEAIDPVRYLSSYSSGKMGFALAEAAAEAGAHVTLITGPVHLETPDRVKRIDVTSALEMLKEVNSCLPKCDIFIANAAVSDYRPSYKSHEKIKKVFNSQDELNLKLRPNPDIVAHVAGLETRPFVVAFAAETSQLEHHAREKLINKKVDLIIANNIATQDIGFASDNNEVMVIGKDYKTILSKRSKRAIARELTSLIAEKYLVSLTKMREHYEEIES